MTSVTTSDEIILFRACLKKRVGDLTGLGASMYPGRWNLKGQAVVYTSENRALALLELRVNNPSMPMEAAGIMVLRLSPGSKIRTIPAGELSEGWNQYGETGNDICQPLGSEWFETSRANVLKVPSAVLPTESNYIVRAGSGVLTQLKDEPLEFDPRLWLNQEIKKRRPSTERLWEMLLAMLNRTPVEPQT